MTATTTTQAAASGRWRQYLALTKPRVVQLIVFCAVIGMLLAEPGWPRLALALPATVGIWLVASAAAAFNCLVEQAIDSKMARTAWRPTAQGTLGTAQALGFSALLGLVLWQAGSGLSNVVLGWPIFAALAHSAGAAGLVALLSSLWARLRAGERALAASPASPARTLAAHGPRAAPTSP